MTRDYKPAPQKGYQNAGKGSGLLTGILIGIVLGVGASVAVAILVKGGESPLHERTTPAEHPEAAPHVEVTPPADSHGEAKPDAKPRFDFYTILPGSETPVTDQELKQARDKQTKETAQPDKSGASENYYLQVGAFQTEGEADNMKAKLALLGLEAVVQTANLPDKGVWHRVRVGPFTDIDQISRARAELTRNGFSADLIKIHSNLPDQ